MSTKVYLVGAGPGDPKLLTLRAIELIETADVIIYDALLDSTILKKAPTHTELIYAGKRAGKHSMKQEEINALLIEKAQTVGGNIVRLKGGDPFVFGRGGEEMMALQEAHIAYEIVPGITAGIAGAAYAGIPVTHRGVSRMVSLITGSCANGDLPDVDWSALAKLNQTMVFYMSVRSIPIIADKLISHGLSETQSAAIISQGTLPTQRIELHTLQEWRAASIDPDQYTPGLFIVGDVVDFAPVYAWTKALPLYKKKIVVTRALYQSSVLAEGLRVQGAEVTLLPTIEIVPREDLSDLYREIENLSAYQWLVFPSTNAVDIFFQSLHHLGKDTRALGSIKIGAVGKVTEKALMNYGIKADFVPQKHTGKDFALELLASDAMVASGNVLIPSSFIAHTDIKNVLEEAGAKCLQLAVYDNRPINYDLHKLKELFSAPIDWLTFCSSSAVTHFMELVEKYGLMHHLLKAKIAVIGELTAQTLSTYGLKYNAMPPEPNMQAMIDEIIKQTIK